MLPSIEKIYNLSINAGGHLTPFSAEYDNENSEYLLSKSASPGIMICELHCEITGAGRTTVKDGVTRGLSLRFSKRTYIYLKADRKVAEWNDAIPPSGISVT